MKTTIQLYSDILSKVIFFSKQLKLKLNKSTGRKLAIPPEETIAFALFKQNVGIPTKKAIWNIFKPKESYKTLCVQMNKLAVYALIIMNMILKRNQKDAHPIKHTDSTDVPVCLNKNAKSHKTMKEAVSWGHSGKGFYYGLKMSLTSDLNRKLLAVRFTSANGNDRETLKEMNKDIMGIFVADAGYASKDLEREFYIENKRILFAKPRANMKKVITSFQYHLYNTRMIIEINFRNLKMLYAFITSFPRSIDGYFANYIYSILSYVLG
ncbi:MAG: Tnp dom protein [Parcubacteria group bacterium]|nr:Tnp dom protein [Parcubacteria group bacterium]